MRRPPSLPELTELFSALCEDTIDDVQFARLNARLEKDADARAHYAVYTDMHCGLSRRWGEPVSVSQPSTVVQAQVSRSRWTFSIAAVAALVVLTSSITLFVVQRIDGPAKQAASPEPPDIDPRIDPEATTDSVAILSSAIDAVWADDGSAHVAGAALSPGAFRLKSGVAVIQFYSGATIILQGPGELQLRTSGEAFCPSGRLSAEVPPQAQGFRIGTPHVVVTDFGTAFGLNVATDWAEVHVFKGEVALTGAAVALANLSEGQAVLIPRGGAASHFSARRDAFVTPQEVALQLAVSVNKRTEQWLASAEKFNADPTLIAHFDFEKLVRGDRVLKNLANNSSGLDGLIVGCAMSEGRWPGKGALEFSTFSDRIRLNVPGEFNALTLSAWVRVDRLDRLFSSLFMVEAFDVGAFHWQITNVGKVRLGVAGPKNTVRSENADYDTPAFMTPDRLGHWMHLVVVYDVTAGVVKHYMDGKLLQQLPPRFKRPLRIGNCEIGNWNPGNQVDRYPIRNLNGRVDEFSIHSRALEDSEIAQMYEQGSTRLSALRESKK